MSRLRTVGQRGLTLLEFSIALAIFALLGAAAYGGLQNVIAARVAVAEQARRLSELQLAWQLLERDLLQAVARPVRDEFGLPRPAFSGAPPAADLPLLSFSRAGWSNPQDNPRAGLQRVAYRLRDDRLLRAYWPVLDGVAGAGREVELLRGVGALRLQFLDRKNDWQTRWPLADGEADNRPGFAGPGFPAGALPRAVEITLHLDDWGEISRLLPLPDGP